MDQSNKEHASKLIGCGAINEPPRVVGNADPRRQSSGIDAGCSGSKNCGGQDHFEQAGCLAMGNTSNTGHTGAEGQGGAGAERQSDGHFAEPTGDNQHEIEPALGGGVNGITDRLDDAKLYVTCDSRVDELRLLGNGVVPACAALAFTTLFNELQETH